VTTHRTEVTKTPSRLTTPRVVLVTAPEAGSFRFSAPLFCCWLVQFWRCGSAPI
jgi:hypothetical protein